MRNSPRKKSPKKSSLYALIMLSIFFLFLLYVWQHARVVKLSYDILRLKKEISSWESENYSLQREIDRYASMERIAYLARNRLGMILPGKENVLMLPDIRKKDRDLARKFTSLLKKAHKLFGVERAEAEIFRIKDDGKWLEDRD